MVDTAYNFLLVLFFSYHYSVEELVLWARSDNVSTGAKL